MRVKIYPSIASGTVTAPPSKSILHRLLIMAALSDGESVINNVVLSDDIRATLRCIRAVGATCEIENDSIKVHGIDPHRIEHTGLMDCGACGSTLRFMIPVCMLCGSTSVLTGSPRLLSRPLSVYESICRERCILYENDGTNVRIGGCIHSGTFTIPGNISSQFVTGLLLVLPLLNNDSEIILTDGIESRPYIDITLQTLRYFGINAFWKNDHTLSVPGGQRYVSGSVTAEGDWSNAAFLLALGGKEHSVNVLKTDESSLQGDKKCVDYFKALEQGHAIIDITDQPDLGPVLFAYAAMNHGAVFTGTARLKIKESDRIAAMAEELHKFGCDLTVKDNEVFVLKTALHAPSVTLCGHDDHRIVMSLAVMCAKYGGEIEGAEAVNKSFPDFFRTLEALGVKIRYEIG